MPPYPAGGTVNQGGAIWAMRTLLIVAHIRGPGPGTGQNAVMPSPWTSSASAPLDGGAVTLVEGSSFCISVPSGDMLPGHPHGLFFRDTRFLTELRVRVNGKW